MAVTFDSTGNPTDTATGTTILSSGTFETVQYRTQSGPQMPTLESITQTHLVTSEYGFSGPGSPIDLSVIPGDTVYHYYSTTNEGNKIMPLSVKSFFHHYNGAANWQVQYWRAGSFIFSVPADTITTESFYLNDNLDSGYFYKVIVPSTTSEAPNTSYITILSTLETSAAPNGKYTGGNAYTYGGKAYNLDQVTDSVAAPVVNLTRTSTVDSPITYTGGRHDAVPGAVITFTMNISNTGGSTAENLVLIDKIPANTTLAHYNTTGTCTNVVITAAQGTAQGTTVYYSTADSPSKTYGASAPDWTLIGTLETGTEMFPGPQSGTHATYVVGNLPYNAKWVKWEAPSLPPDTGVGQITWGVTIR